MFAVLEVVRVGLFPRERIKGESRERALKNELKTERKEIPSMTWRITGYFEKRGFLIFPSYNNQID